MINYCVKFDYFRANMSMANQSDLIVYGSFWNRTLRSWNKTKGVSLPKMNKTDENVEYTQMVDLKLPCVRFAQVSNFMNIQKVKA